VNKYIIVVEGSADAVFINDLIFSIKNENSLEYIKLKKFKTGVKYKISDSPLIYVFIAGGCSKIVHYKIKIEEFQDQDYKILMIQDADNEKKDKKIGGVIKRMKYLDDIKKEHNLTFSTFLFPNNESDGDLETILLSIVNESKFGPFIESYQSYAKQVSSFTEIKHVEEILEDKYKVFGYCQVYSGMEKANEKSRNYNSLFWNLKSQNLNKLTDFLKKEIIF